MIHLEVNEQTRETEYYENVDYQAFWQGIQQAKLDELEQQLVRNMLHLPVRRMMDIGCGYGRLMDNYLSSCQEVILLDSSSSLLQQAHQRSNGKAICISCDLHQLPFFDGTFDQLMMVRVFHHLPDSEKVLSELNRVLCDGGHLLFSYCNKKNLERVVRWLICKNPYNPFYYETAWVWNVFYMHHPRYVHDILNSVGFEESKECGAGIMDKIAGIFGKFGGRFPSGFKLAPLFAQLGWAPWVFCDSRKRGALSEASDLPFDQVLACPECHVHLERKQLNYSCPSCGKVYPIKNGVIHFISP